MSNSLKTSGRIHQIGDTQSFGTKGFQKREFVVEIDLESKWPQMIKFEATKEGCDRLDGYQPGDMIEVEFNLRGNEHAGKFYTNLQAWKLTKLDDGLGVKSPEHGRPDTGRAAPPNSGRGMPSAPANVPDDDFDDDSIPF